MADTIFTDGDIADALAGANPVEDLIAIRGQLIANVLAESKSPKPSYSIDGESVDWNTWQNSQLEQIQKLTKMIHSMRPFVITTRLSL